MNNVLQHGIKTALTIGLIIGVTACDDESAIDKVVDKMDKKYSTEISYINAVNASTTFYAKSNLYTRGVYDSDFKVVNLLENKVSRKIDHKWSSHGHKFEFAIKDTNSGARTADVKYNVQNKGKYWAIAWMDNNSDVLSIFEMKPSNQNDVFRVRVFANTALSVKILGSDADFTETIAGEVSETYTINNCADLYVGGNEIDLCQQGDFGQSYLVVVDSQGLITYGKE
ncbi:hypothetical protein [Colwellia sp. Bg11-28]|uniref:hypothetical protein n=1 Tax=Colwellia sp. Bg11-28 TaxID=2058305 RepID=UPI000C3470D3|nr:hypothetical protein [Colwellia sp. Bg11-28]PKH87615.1 hypothetical protein CXF79_13305 [Colwellia sp. Bg11-28]